MNDNQKCLLRILQAYGNKLTTQQILHHTKKFPDLCRGCSSGTQIISAGMELMRDGKITRSIAKGGFVWSLKD